MLSYSQHMATAIAAATKNALDGAPATLIKPGRPRTISEILDIAETFVCGYPQSAEEPKRFDRN
jgi:hypothetical protein